MHEGCGKSYSRAEHLSRHQLNRKSAPFTSPGVRMRMSNAAKTLYGETLENERYGAES